MMETLEVLCTGTSLDGKPCTRHRTPGKEQCRWHTPEALLARAEQLEAQAAAIRGAVKAS